LPRPLEALVHYGTGNVLDAFHQLDELLSVPRLAGRKADAAVTHHGRGDAVPGRRRRVRVPGRLAVIVGVNVDEAGRHDAAFGVDLLGAGARDLADSSDAPVPDGDIGLARRGPCAVDHRAVADDEVILLGHWVSSSLVY